MKNYLKPSISEVESDALLAKLQGTGVALTCEGSFCDDYFGWGCDDETPGVTHWGAVFYASQTIDIDSCRIVVGDRIIGNCEYKIHEPCEGIQGYSLDCVTDIGNCDPPSASTVSVVCDGAQVECSPLT